MNSSAQLSAAQHLASSGAGVSALTEKRGGEENEEEDDIPELEATVEDEGPVDETGVSAEDIALVMDQVGCSRAEAVKALRNTKGDLIHASTFQIWCFPLEFFLNVVSSYRRQQRVEVLYRYVHYTTYVFRRHRRISM